MLRTLLRSAVILRLREQRRGRRLLLGSLCGDRSLLCRDALTVHKFCLQIRDLLLRIGRLTCGGALLLQDRDLFLAQLLILRLRRCILTARIGICHIAEQLCFQALRIFHGSISFWFNFL